MELEHRLAGGERAEHGHEAEGVVELRQERRRVAPDRVRQHQNAPAFGDGGADPLGQLGPEIGALALPLQQERCRDQALGPDHEDGDGRLALDLSLLGQDADAVTAEDDWRAGDAPDRVQEGVRVAVRVAGDEDERQVGAIGSTLRERLERRLERGVVGRPADGEPGSGGHHGWTLALCCYTSGRGLRIRASASWASA